MNAAHTDSPVIRLESLSIAIRDAVAGSSPHLLRDLNLSVARGERLGIIGESGSGKSLTVLASVGLLPRALIATGHAWLDGVDMLGAPEAVRVRQRGRVAAVVFQEPLSALDPLMRLGKQLAIPLARFRGLRGAPLRAAVRAALTEVQLAEPDRIAAAYPHEVSGGQRQRVALALALACNPAVLIADEPTTALDVTVQAAMLDLIDTVITDRGMGLVFVSHDLAVVARVCERVVVMRAGELVEAGSAAEVLSQPRHPYTIELVSRARELDALLQGVAVRDR